MNWYEYTALLLIAAIAITSLVLTLVKRTGSSSSSPTPSPSPSLSFVEKPKIRVEDNAVVDAARLKNVLFSRAGDEVQIAGVITFTSGQRASSSDLLLDIPAKLIDGRNITFANGVVVASDLGDAKAGGFLNYIDVRQDGKVVRFSWTAKSVNFTQNIHVCFLCKLE